MANQRWKFDSTELDLLVADIVNRHPLGQSATVMLIDRYTKYALAFTISYSNPIQSLPHASFSSYYDKQTGHTDKGGSK